MAKALLRLTEKLYNTPQLITSAAADEILSYLEIRNSSDYVIKSIEAKVNKNFFGAERTRDASTLENISENGVAILDIDGPLSYTVSDLDALCGAVSYEQIQFEFDAAVNSPDIHTIVMYIDSPGGQAYGCFELANYMRKKSKEKGKKLITYVDGGMYSAALALGVAADEVVANPFADQGSIGVLIRLMNTHKFNKKLGLEETFIFAGEEKIPYDAKGDFKKEFIDGLQEKVDALYQVFVSHVASCRGMKEAAVIGTKAKTFSSAEAVKLGLIDKVMEREEFFNYLADGKSNTSKVEAIPSVGVSAEATSTTVGGTEDQLSMTTSTGVIQKSDEDNSEMPISQQELEVLQKQLKESQEAAAAALAQVADLTAANQKFLQEQAERAKGELKGKLSGYSFINSESATSLTETLSKLQDSEKGVVLAAFDKATESLNTLTAKVKELETELNKDLFRTVSRQGDAIEDSDDDKKLKSAVSKTVAAKIGEKK